MKFCYRSITSPKLSMLKKKETVVGLKSPTKSQIRDKFFNLVHDVS